jgi:hypothetical protein
MAGDLRPRSSAHQRRRAALRHQASAVEAIEVGDAVDAEQHRFALQDEGVGAVAQRGLDNARVPVACGSSRTVLPSR